MHSLIHNKQQLKSCTPQSHTHIKCSVHRRHVQPCRAISSIPSQTTHQFSTPQESSTPVYFRADWHQAKLHGSLNGGPWEDFQMEQITLVNQRWHTVELPMELPSNGTATGNGKPLAEFVFTDGSSYWDKPKDGGNYVITEQGVVYRVVGGLLAPVKGKRVLVVSDLDDTLIGNDDATLEFTQYWQQQACLLGSKLVYNTGRALDKFLALLEEKHWCMAEPDCLISSVGTRIYTKQKNGQWTEDEAYAKFLDKDWDLAVMREGAYEALAAVGNDAMHFRPPDEQNDHKITVGVQVAVLDKVQAMLRDHQGKQGIRAKLVASGKGEWRFLDIISPQAGKLAALEYIRKQYGFEHNETVACGDSGNDIDMLKGRNFAIAVGNAQPDLLRWMDSLTESDRVTDDGQVRLYHSKAHMAEGILEGLQHWGFK